MNSRRKQKTRLSALLSNPRSTFSKISNDLNRAAFNHLREADLAKHLLKIKHASRITYHASRITYHASRITHHVSRITPSPLPSPPPSTSPYSSSSPRHHRWWDRCTPGSRHCMGSRALNPTRRAKDRRAIRRVANSSQCLRGSNRKR